MRILWVTNQPIAYLRDMLKISLGQSGGWMEQSYGVIKESPKFTIGVATIYEGTELLHSQADGNDFYAVPSRQTMNAYDSCDFYNLSQWDSVINDFKPDLIHVWGSEYPIGLCALKAAKGIPSVVYMQGMLNQLANHYCDGVSPWEQLRYISIVDIKRWNFLWSRKKSFEKAAKREAELLNLANNVIVESDWCAYNCLSVAPKCTVYRSALPISSVYFEYDWDYEKCEKHSIFTVAGGYPIKGHHMLLKAFAKVVKEYPDAKLYIPGQSNVTANDFKNRIRKTTYDNIISAIIKEYHLQNNIVYLGRLSPEQMAQQIEKCNIFVMPSSCENHSSSLIEAMIVGAPTISSYVGGISQYYKDGDNGLFYRFDEPDVLSAMIVKYFENKDFTKGLAQKGKKRERDNRSGINLIEDYNFIYNSIVIKNSKGL